MRHDEGGERATQRRNLVLDVMLETGLIDAAEHRRARAAPLAEVSVERSCAARGPAPP